QREGVGVPLAAVADNRDRTVLDQAQLSGVVVVHRGHVKCFSLGVGAAHFWGGLERSLRILGEVWYVWRQTLGRFGTPSPKPWGGSARPARNFGEIRHVQRRTVPGPR